MLLQIVPTDRHQIDQLVRAAFSDLLGGDSRSLPRVKTLMERVSAHEQKTLLYCIIRILSEMHLFTNGPTQDLRREGQSKAVEGAAALIKAVVGDLQLLLDYLVEWLVGVSADAVAYGHVAHRAVIAALSSIPGEYLSSAPYFS